MTSYKWADFNMMKNQGIDMRRFLTAALLVTTLGLGWAPSLLAQGYKSAVGWSGGVFLPTSLNDGAMGADFVDLKPDLTWMIGGHFDRWLGSGNLGIRARVAFTKPSIPWAQGYREIRTYLMDMGLLLRPLAATPERSILPFIHANQ